MDDIQLGGRYRDRVSGWEGIVTARHEYMNGCLRYTIDATDKDGKPEGFVFDGEQLERVDADENVTVWGNGETRRAVGGPRDNRPIPR